MASNLQKFYLKKDEFTYWTLPVEQTTTAKDVCDAIASKLELKSGSCVLLEAKVDKGTTWEREVLNTERVMNVQSKWNPKKYAERFVIVKPKLVRRETRNSLVIPSNASNEDDENKYLAEGRKQQASDEVLQLQREIQFLAESKSKLQQEVFDEKQKRNAMKNSSEVVKQLMEAEQEIDDLKLIIRDLQERSNHLDNESILTMWFMLYFLSLGVYNQLFNELNDAARTIGGSFEEKVTARRRIPYNSATQNSPQATNPRAYFEGNRSSENSPYTRRKQDGLNMTSADYDRNLEVASLGLDMAELQKSQRARERALDESKAKLREELEMSKQRRSDVLKESNQVLLEELEAIKSKSDLSKKKFVDSLHDSKKKLEQELDMIEKKRKAQEEVRWSRPMNGYSTTSSPSKQDGFSLSPSLSPTPSRRGDYGSPSKFDGLSTAESISFSLDRPSTPQFSSKTDRYSTTPTPGSAPASPAMNDRYSSSPTPTTRFSPLPERSASPLPDRFSSKLDNKDSLISILLVDPNHHPGRLTAAKNLCSNK